MTKYSKEIIDSLIAAQPKDIDDLAKIKRRLARQYKSGLLANSHLITALNEHPEAANLNWLKQLLKKRAVRTLSGVAPVAVLIKPFACPGNCAFCPNEKDVPQSYLPNEPAVMRAIRCHYNPAEQVRHRIKALEANGHNPEKIELIVIGGTWSYYPIKYRYWYLASCFMAANNIKGRKNEGLSEKSSLEDLKKWLAKEQKKNESAKYRIIGITLETRPDYINDKELHSMRELGCTRVEIGVQAVDDDILRKNLRGSTVADIIRATKALKNFGFKVTYHFMPALPGSTPAHDLEMYREIFTDESEMPKVSWPLEENYNQDKLKNILQAPSRENDFNPDQLKFYPTVVTQGSLLYKWWQAGEYIPYDDATLTKLIIDCKKSTPPFVRIVRLIRDIPGESIIAGNKVTNLRQVIQSAGNPCRCIRCREPKEKIAASQDLNLVIRKYRASKNDEFFISIEDKNESTIYGFVRLRLAAKEAPQELDGHAIIRELHVYGQLTQIGKSGQTQHRGLGRSLMALAEKIAKQSNHKKISVIAGVGVRDYYRHLGYRLNHSYMSKNIK